MFVLHRPTVNTPLWRFTHSGGLPVRVFHACFVLVPPRVHSVVRDRLMCVSPISNSVGMTPAVLSWHFPRHLRTVLCRLVHCCLILFVYFSSPGRRGGVGLGLGRHQRVLFGFRQQRRRGTAKSRVMFLPPPPPGHPPPPYYK